MQPIKPFVAYLEGLRGRPKSSSGPLDVERIRSFGLPYALPGDESAASLEARSERFLKNLWAAVDALEPTQKVVAEHYFFGSGTSRQRENAAVSALPGASDSTARNSQKSALEGVARQFLEHGETPTQPGTREPLAETVEAISSLYPAGSDLRQLAAMIVPSRPPVEDAEISLTLEDAEDASLYSLLLTNTTLTRSGPFYLAITSRATLSDLIVTMCPKVGEVFACSSAADVEQRATEWSERGRSLFTAIGKDDRGLTTRSALSLERLSDEDKASVLTGLSDEDIDATAVLAAEIPDRIAAKGLVSIEVRLYSQMERRDHYCYWLANRPTFVKKIAVNWSALTLPEDQKIRLRSTIRATAYEPHYDDSGCEFRVDGWLVAGQGVLVTW
jgi:hypothetical protein